MDSLKLNDGLLLLIEPDNSKLRLILTDGIKELACRKETPRKLTEFLSSAEEIYLFKGRLQLHKINHRVELVLKGEPVGSVDTFNLKKALNLLS